MAEGLSKARFLFCGSRKLCAELSGVLLLSFTGIAFFTTNSLLENAIMFSLDLLECSSFWGRGQRR